MHILEVFTLHVLEVACTDNFKFIILLQDSKLLDYSTISRFLNKIKDLLLELFEQFIKKILKSILINILLFGRNLLKTIEINLTLKFNLLFLILIESSMLCFLLSMRFVIIFKI